MSTQGLILQQLNTNERRALQAFIVQLRQRYGTGLRRVVLFGSKARGDFDDESDLDVLVVVRTPGGEFWPLWQQIADIAWKVEFEYGVVLTTIIRSPAEYRQMQRDNLLLFRNIDRDGVVLWTSKPDVPTYESV
jgi:predicted nucleotidyltransferase